MIVQPKVRGFICLTAHPVGCQAHVMQQIDYVKKQNLLTHPPKKVLVIGASTGYGLASRIVATFGAKAKTIGVFFERPADDKRTASAGWYNTISLERTAHTQGLYAKSINGDAFSEAIKQQTINLIKHDWKEGIDLVIYSLASPRRTDPKTGAIYNSTLKTTTPDKNFTGKGMDVFSGTVTEINVGSATEEEIEQTIKVMGGEDWQLWIEALLKNNCLAPGAMTLAYSYIGPQITHDIYHHGTIGRAKAHLEKTAKLLDKKLHAIGGHAYISVNKALVTQASSALPIVPLYISILYKVMKEKNLQEGCIEQMVRLFKQLYGDQKLSFDKNGLIRLDDWEMRTDVQEEVSKRWHLINTDNITNFADLAGYRHEFYRLFGFDIKGIDYTADVEINLTIPSIKP